MARTVLLGWKTAMKKAGGAKSKPKTKPGSKTRTGPKAKAKPRTGSKARTGTKPKPRPAAASGGDAVSEASPMVRGLVMAGAFVAMVGFAVVLARLTLVPSMASEAMAHTNLQPGESINNYLSQPAFRDTVKQLGGNIVLGVPFGLLLPVLVPKARGLLRVVLVTALFMVLVELVQGAIVTGRAFDIDDVILNTSGALLGYLLLGRRMGRAVHPPRRHWWQRWTKQPVAHSR
ncbi:VanZ family protein [Streptomyces meridianus]|uniref:VanZ family protein n=1 Tax=Streptomyces meridianus TaxID=2938945 RepID=A0ABT0X5M0_9ACTN|nr:VanZ family protein [Streptomyces meridianus]MCM2577837.1 VanZ family protein [Streptomyces meridianus]